MSTSYSNPCGMGNRSSLMVVTVSSGLTWGSTNPTTLVNGLYDNGYAINPSVTGYIIFDFKTRKAIDEVKIYINSYDYGNYKFLGSNDNINYIDVSNSFNLSRDSGQVYKVIVLNIGTKCRYLKMQGITLANDYLKEFEFKIDDSPYDKHLIKQDNQYYSINTTYYDSTTTHNFTPLTLTGGSSPNKSDIDSFGFTDLNLLTNSMTVASDTFIPVLKFDNTAQLKTYKPS